jgi:DNA-binding transcriptional MerR regulator
MPFKRKYSEDKLTKAMLLSLDQNMSLTEVSKITGIPVRTLQRYKSKNLDDLQEKQEKTDYPAVFKGDAPVSDSDVQKQLDATMLARAKFLDNVFDAKKAVLERIVKIAKKSENLDALQRTVKTLDEIENKVVPDGDTPPVHAKTVNMFQFFNQQLIQDGYKGPELTPSDIVKGD